MCGIVGVINQSNQPLSEIEKKLFLELFGYAISRGSDASGLLMLGAKQVILKSGQTSRGWLKQGLRNEILSSNIFGLIGHTRMATNGDDDQKNIQPIEIGDMILFHNGIALNLHDDHVSDSVLLAKMIANEWVSIGNLYQSVVNTMKKIQGECNLVVVNKKNYHQIYGYTNTGSLYAGKKNDLILFGSESRWLRRLDILSNQIKLREVVKIA